MRTQALARSFLLCSVVVAGCGRCSFNEDDSADGAVEAGRNEGGLEAGGDGSVTEAGRGDAGLADASAGDAGIDANDANAMDASGMDGAIEAGLMDATMDAMLPPSGPPTTVTYIKASNTGRDDRFGGAIAIDGDVMVIGARNEDSEPGDPEGAGAQNSGAAYVFRRGAGGWQFEAMLKAPMAYSTVRMGSSVDISGDTIVLGAPQHGGDDPGINSDESDRTPSTTGAVFVYRHSGATWQKEAFIRPLIPDGGDLFGTSVSIDGDILVAGAPMEDGPDAQINGNAALDNRLQAGAAYVFRRVGTTWSQEAYLKAYVPSVNQNFGRALAISGTTIVVGAHRDAANGEGVGADPAMTNAVANGSVTVFEYVAGGWTRDTYIKPLAVSSNDQFGSSLSIDGDTFVVGTAFEDSDARTVDGDATTNTRNDSGAAYIFVRDGSSWKQDAFLKSFNSDALDSFGHSVSISGERVVVGAYREDSLSIGIDSDATNNTVQGAGAAYLFERVAGGWSQTSYLKSVNTAVNDGLGIAVGISGGTIVVGAEMEDGEGRELGGDPLNNSESNAGALYLYE